MATSTAKLRCNDTLQDFPGGVVVIRDLSADTGQAGGRRQPAQVVRVHLVLDVFDADTREPAGISGGQGGDRNAGREQ